MFNLFIAIYINYNAVLEIPIIGPLDWGWL